MKKAIVILFLLISACGFGQSILQKVTVFDTTRTDGTRFIISYPYGIRYKLVDSTAIPYGQTTVQVIGDYISTRNSMVFIKAKRLRIVLDDTLERYEELVIPL